MNIDTVLGRFEVHTTTGRGATPEELAERALDKILYIGGNAHPAIRDQAEAFKDAIRGVIVYYMAEAARGERVTLANALRQAGHPELIPVLDR